MEILPSKIFSCLVSLLVGCFVFGVHADQELSARGLLERCDKEGSVTLINELTLGKQWRQITDKIATGEDAWVEVAGCLSRGVYFGKDETAYGFFVPALAKALLRDPNTVLSLESSGVSLGDVCRLPFWEEDFAFIEDYIGQVLPILDEKAIIGKRVNMDYAEICALRMRDAYERTKAEIREREERIRRQNLRHNSNESSP